jgi:hypothetical protein
MVTAISGRRRGREGAGKAEASGDQAAGEQARQAGRPQEQLPFVPPTLSRGPQHPRSILGQREATGTAGSQHLPSTCPSLNCPTACPCVPFLEGFQGGGRLVPNTILQVRGQVERTRDK